VRREKGRQGLGELLEKFKLKNMFQLKTFTVLEEKRGEIVKSGLSGESLYYAVSWEELEEAAGRAAHEKEARPPNDVRAAGYALDLLGIPNQYVEADQDEAGDWVIYWR
jgi:hypothetical protein